MKNGRRVVVFFLLAFSACRSGGGGGGGGPIVPLSVTHNGPPPGVSTTTPQFDPRYLYCHPLYQVVPSPYQTDVADPEPELCTKGWHVDSIPIKQANGTKYVAMFPDDCYYNDQSGYVECYFKDAMTSCADAAKANNNIENPNNTGTQWALASVTEVQGSNMMSYTCNFTTTPGNGMQSLQTNYTGPLHRGDKVPFMGMFVDVAGPYRDMDPIIAGAGYDYGGMTLTAPMPGLSFQCTWVRSQTGQLAPIRDLVVGLNKQAHNNSPTITSDLAGMTYTPPGGDPNNCFQKGSGGQCVEPTTLLDTPGKPNSAELHHVVPRKNGQKGTSPTCRWGKNSMKNAALISRQLNQVLSNGLPPDKEIMLLNNAAPYPTVPLKPI